MAGKRKVYTAEFKLAAVLRPVVNSTPANRVEKRWHVGLVK